ncbi:MAG: trypsin-like peptidase domain-containing protein, partial [Oscillospiraceae bacterium]
TYSAKIIGADSKSDLAVIKIEGENLPVAEFGNSDELQVGEKVIAIGNPGSSVLAGSVTQGIVSGVNRTIKEGGYSVNYIQVDAAINPGNSGGALVNSFGQVVGINSAKIAAVDYEGIGFSIPIKDAKPIIDDLKANGYVSGRTKIGINGKAVPQILADINNLPTGVMIVNIETTSDLANTKATQGDIITHIDGVRVEDFDQISDCLAGKKAGDVIKISLFRPLSQTGGQSFDVSCKLMPDVEKSKYIII